MPTPSTPTLPAPTPATPKGGEPAPPMRVGVSAPADLRTIAEVAQSFDMTATQLAGEIEAARPILYEARSARVPPLRDEKVLTSWNGLMLSAFARGGRILEDARFVEAAIRNGEFLMSVLSDQDRLKRVSVDGQSKYDGFLDDYAFVIAGFLDLYTLVLA